MTEAIDSIKKLITNHNNTIFFDGEAFSGYQKTYFTTNENIKAYLDLVNLDDYNNALTVLASGDQLFNLINKGILEVDTFDINKFTEYYVFGLRMAMIDKYNYKDYLKVFNKLLDEKTSFEELNDILYGLLPFMDMKYREFWKEILDYNYILQKDAKERLNITRMLFFGFLDNNHFNNYLLNDEEYNKLKSNLNRAKISFSATNAVDLYKKNNKKYDLVLLSNILDYIYSHLGVNWDINKFVGRLTKICSENYIIFLHYLFDYYSNNYTKQHNLIYGAKNLDKLLEKYPVEKIPFSKDKKIGEGIILIKK